MPTHAADTLRRRAGHDARPLLDASARGAGLTPERRLAMQDAFRIPPLADYGLSEVPGHAAHALQEPEAKMLTTEGRPYDGTEIRIVDRDGAPLPAGQVGDVVVNGPSRFLFFLGNDDLTRNSLTSWGGYRTGDLGYLDDDGHLVYVGRSKDIIRRGGVTVVPAELEPVLTRHPGIHEAAVVPCRTSASENGRAPRSSSGAASGHRRSPSCSSSRARGHRQVHVAGVDRGLRRVSAHTVAEGRQARARAAIVTRMPVTIELR